MVSDILSSSILPFDLSLRWLTGGWDELEAYLSREKNSDNALLGSAFD